MRSSGRTARGEQRKKKHGAQQEGWRLKVTGSRWSPEHLVEPREPEQIPQYNEGLALGPRTAGD